MITICNLIFKIFLYGHFQIICPISPVPYLSMPLFKSDTWGQFVSGYFYMNLKTILTVTIMLSKFIKILTERFTFRLSIKMSSFAVNLLQRQLQDILRNFQ